MFSWFVVKIFYGCVGFQDFPKDNSYSEFVGTIRLSINKVRPGAEYIVFNFPMEDHILVVGNRQMTPGKMVAAVVSCIQPDSLADRDEAIGILRVILSLITLSFFPVTGISSEGKVKQTSQRLSDFIVTSKWGEFGR